jgi:hydroxyacylglutathione hydrolase
MNPVNHLVPLPAFEDNYIWLLHNTQRAVVVDPGDASVVLEALAHLELALDTILVTHHHADHTGGVAQLRQATGCAVVGPAREQMPEPIVRLQGGDHVTALGLRFEVLDVPGHTAGHIAFYCADAGGQPLLFCGDTLFSGGCGRLFEGTPAQMHASLAQLAQLPGHTRVCCTHEYTLSNLKFASAVEPNNADLAQYQRECVQLRAQHLPTLPSSVARELAINPFLRCQAPDVVLAAQQHSGAAPDALSVFTALRQWKNNFQ